MPGLPRAYLRMDPNIDQHPDPLAMVRLMCAAARQSKRGRFKDASALTRLLGKRTVAGLVERADVVPLSDGTVYVDGWDEWQEGDLTVRDRMARLRSRNRDITVTAPSQDRTNTSARASSTPTLTPTLEDRRSARDDVDEDEDPAWLRAWLSVKMRMPTVRQRDVILAYLRVFDETGPERASRVFLANPTDPLGALIADLEEFRNGAKVDAEKAEAEAKERRREQRRGFRKGSVEYELAQQLYAKSEGRL